MQISKNLFTSLRWKISFAYLLIIGIGFFVINVSTMEILEQDMIDGKKVAYQKYAIQTAQSMASYFYNKHHSVSQRIKELGDEITDAEGEPTRVLLLDKSGVVVHDSYNDFGHLTSLFRKNLQQSIPEIERVLKGEFIPAIDLYANVGTPQTRKRIMYSFAPITHDIEGVIGMALIATSLENVETVLSDIQGMLNIYMAFIGLSIILISFTISGFITQPIKELTTSIDLMSKGHLNQRIHIKGRDELYRLGQAFNLMSERLENLDKARNDFVSNASHELKTPLSAIKVLAESLLVMEEQDPEIFKEFLTDINNEIDRLNAIITDLLSLVHIDNKEYDVATAPVSLVELVDDIIKKLDVLAAKKSIELKGIFNEDIVVSGNAKQLQQLILNLIDNGIKYTPEEGKVTVEVYKSSNSAVIKIEDTGIGIPQDEIPYIFERFYRVDKARSRATGGTGLGLSIAQRIVLMHHGSIHVDSEEGTGTAFYIMLPLDSDTKNGTNEL